MDGSSAPKAAASHTHVASDIVSGPYQSWGGDLENMPKRSEDFSNVWSTDGGAKPKVASGTRKISLAIADNSYSGCLAGPTQVTLTTSWQRFNVTPETRAPADAAALDRKLKTVTLIKNIALGHHDSLD